MSANWHDLKGQLITRVVASVTEDEVTVYTTNIIIRAYHQSECCESVRLIRTEGDIENLAGATILNAEDDSGAQDPDWYKETYDDYSHTWTKLTLNTTKGDVHFWFLGESNGYYGETLDFQRL